MFDFNGIQKKTVIGGAIASIWVILTLVILGVFGIHHAWPAFLTILFYVEHKDIANLPNVFVGAITGLLMAACVPYLTGFIEPVTGIMIGKLTAVFLIIFLIIVLKDVSHLFFNHYNLVYLTVALIFAKEQQTFSWIGILIGGGILLTGGFIITVKYAFKLLEID